jgi:type IV secretion system protein TrbJ
MIYLLFILLFFSSMCNSFVVFDPSNFVKNSLTAAQTAEQIMYLTSQYETQMRQFETQLLQLKNLPVSSINSLLSKNHDDLLISTEFFSKVQSIYGSINQIQDNFKKRLDSAKMLNLDWNQYVAYEKNRIDRVQSDAISISSNDLSALSRLKRDYEFASEIEMKIGTTSGVHEAMQLLNVQVNRIITQNADFLKTLNVSINTPSSGVNLLERNFKDQLELNRKLARENLDRSRYEGELKVFNILGNGYFRNDK